MNAIDMICSNLFLTKLFPEGLTEPIYIGQFGLDVAGRFSMNIHIQQKPAIKVARWGKYGDHYDVIVIRLLGCEAKNISFENWINADFAFFDFSKEGDDIRITAREANWAFDVTVGNFNFQGCNTYIDGREDS
ncbi:hypothetical protein ACIQAL_26820 [Pseudomonas sp. NPDC088368]|jgi:hypothetical protein|uniref:hypothetical protein n=1 Tax=Pseudomonas sp. NPDC088368 TaxID=3364453 RepID=UPI00380D8199